MIKFLSTFFSKLKSVFVKADRALAQVQDLLPEALHVVEIVAAATPSRTDDEIVRLAKQYRLELPPFGNKENLLRAVARLLLSRRVGLKIPDSVANAAIELAVVVYKNGHAAQ